MLPYNRNIIAIGGPKGVGKSTLLKSLHSYYPHIQIISVGSELNRIARSINNQPFLSLSLNDRRRVRKIFSRDILKTKDSIILDMHFGEFENEGYPCTIPINLQKNITHCILIIATPKIIFTRRHLRRSVSRLDMPSIVLNIYGEKIIYEQLIQRYCMSKLIVNNENKKNSILKLKYFFKKNGIDSVERSEQIYANM